MGTRSVLGDPESWFVMGLAAVEGGRLDEAAHALMHAVELAPAALGRGLTAARRLASAGSHAGAERILRRMVSQSRGRPEVRAALVELLIETGQDRIALAEIAGGLDGDPGSLELRLLAATAHERLGEIDRAVDQLALVLATDEDNVPANRRLAGLLARAGDRQGALACWRRVVALTGDDAEAQRMLNLQAPSDRLPFLTDLETDASGPELADSVARLGIALMAADRLEEAIGTFDHALAIDERSAEAHLGLGLAYQRQGRWREAAEAFRVTERLAPGNALGPLNLALALEELGDRDESRLALLRAASLAPEDDVIRRTLERVVFPTSARSLGSSSLPGIGLFDVLELLRLQRKSGSLAISSPLGTGAVRLWRGSITSASGPELEPLLQVLAARGLADRVSPAADEEAIGRSLLEEGLVERAQLGRLFFMRILDVLAEMATWSDAAYSFRPREDDAPPPVNFSVKHLILELCRRSDEAVRARASGRLPQ